MLFFFFFIEVPAPLVQKFGQRTSPLWCNKGRRWHNTGTSPHVSDNAACQVFTPRPSPADCLTGLEWKEQSKRQTEKQEAKCKQRVKCAVSWRSMINFLINYGGGLEYSTEICDEKKKVWKYVSGANAEHCNFFCASSFGCDVSRYLKIAGIWFAALNKIIYMD